MVSRCSAVELGSAALFTTVYETGTDKKRLLNKVKGVMNWLFFSFFILLSEVN